MSPPARVSPSHSAPAISGSARLSAASILFSGAEPLPALPRSASIFEGPAPPSNFPSKKTGAAACEACLRNLKTIRTKINRRYATTRKKRNEQPPLDSKLQHRYNTRSQRQRAVTARTKRTCDQPSEPRDAGRRKRRRIGSPPPKGIEILGVNFPT